MPICTAGIGGGACAKRILLDKIREIAGNRTRDARILDVGCGAGLFFDALEQFGHVEGIESDPIAVDQSGRWKSRIHPGELDTFSAERTVRCHPCSRRRRTRPQPRHSCSGRLPGSSRRDGRMLITTPAFDWLWTSHDRLNHHVKRYTAAEMRDLVRKRRARADRDALSLPVARRSKLLVRMAEAFRPAAPSVPRVPPRALTARCETWFRAENAIAGWLPFGSSVLAVASAARAMKRVTGCRCRPSSWSSFVASCLRAEARSRRRHGGRRCVVRAAGEGACGRSRLRTGQCAAGRHPAGISPGFPAIALNRLSR